MKHPHDERGKVRTPHSGEEVVFRRSMGLRLLFGFGGVFLALLMMVAIQREQRDAALHQQAAWIANTLGDNVLMFALLLLFLGLPCALFLWMAGPYQVQFDLNQSQYCLAQGFPLMTQIRRGSTKGGAFYVVRSRSGQYLMKFCPSGHKWGYLLDAYDTDDQARTEAHRLADALGLIVERRDVN